jgi:hypothetical protein
MKIQEFLKQQGIDKMSKDELAACLISVETDIKELIDTNGDINKIQMLNQLSVGIISLWLKK